MRHRWHRIPAILAAAVGWGSGLAAQEPPPTPEALAAGARTARAVIDPYPVRMNRGDSVLARFTLVDSAGTQVDGARWSLRTDGGLVHYHAVDTAGVPHAYMFGGERPGTQVFLVAVQVRGPAGALESRVVDSLPVTVSDWPIARIEIADLEYEPYSGTTFRLKAKAITTHDSEPEHVHLAWRTDDPCYARVMPDGVVTFGAPAKITVTARAEGVSAKKEIRIASNPVATVSMTPKWAQTRAGDVVKFRVYPEDRRGESVSKIALSYLVRAVDSVGAQFDDDGNFVAERPGTYVLTVSAGDVKEEAVVEVTARPAATPVELTGRGAVKSVASAALAVFTGKDGRDYAYTGTTGGAGRIYVWDVSDAARPTLTDSVSLEAGDIADLKVNGDASWAAVARTNGSGSGIAVLNLASPGHPRVEGRLGDSLSAGVNALWISANWVFAANARTGSLEIVDLSDPGAPRYGGRWAARPGAEQQLYGLFGDQKYLYLAQGADGLVVVDVGDNGSPTAPKLVSQLKWPQAAAHSVVRAGRYAYVAEERAGCDACVNGPRGFVRVIDVSKLKEPKEVARYEVPEAGAGRVWVENSVLYVGYRQGGLRMVDVSGELRGDLYRQGRQVGWFMTAASEETAFRPNSSLVLMALPFKGRVFAADANSGLWVLAHRRAARLAP